MSLQKQIKIGGLVYDVEHKADIKDYWGKVSYGERKIVLEKNWPNKTQELNTILHECIHGILEERGIKHKESLVLSLGNGLTALLKDNPKLLKHIQTLV